MSQENKDKADAAEARIHETRGFMQQVRVAARRKYIPEEKVRIVLEGFRREVAVRDFKSIHIMKKYLLIWDERGTKSIKSTRRTFTVGGIALPEEAVAWWVLHSAYQNTDHQ